MRGPGVLETRKTDFHLRVCLHFFAPKLEIAGTFRDSVEGLESDLR
jgi:hypothetical protein